VPQHLLRSQYEPTHPRAFKHLGNKKKYFLKFLNLIQYPIFIVQLYLADSGFL